MHSSGNSTIHSSHMSEPEDALPQAVVVCGVRLAPASSSRNAEDYAGQDLAGRLITAFHLVGEVQAFDNAVHWYYAPLDDYDRKKIRIDDSVVAAAATASSPGEATTGAASEPPKIFLRLGLSNTFRRYAVPSDLSPTTELLAEAIATLSPGQTAAALDERAVRYHAINVLACDTAPDTSPLCIDKDHKGHTTGNGVVAAPDLPSGELDRKSNSQDDLSLPDFCSPLPPDDIDENYRFPSIVPLWSSDTDAMVQSSTYRSLVTSGATYATHAHASHPSLSMDNHNYDESAVAREHHVPSSSGRLRCRSGLARSSAASVADKSECDCSGGGEGEGDELGGGGVADALARANAEDLAARCMPILHRPDGSNGDSHASASSSMGQSTLHQQGGSSITRLVPQKPVKPPSARFCRPTSGVATTYVPPSQE